MNRGIKAAAPKKTGNVGRDARADETTTAAWSILNAEASARKSKTARLRAARIKAVAEAPLVVAPAERKSGTNASRSRPSSKPR